MSLKLSDQRSEFSHKVAALYLARREEAALRGEVRRKEALLRYPALKAADQAVKEAGSRRLAASLAGDEVVRDAETRLAQMLEKRQSVLRELGLPVGFDGDDYLCKDCEDSGLLNGRRCHCFAAAVYPILLEESGMGHYTAETFDQFRLELFSDQPDPNEKEGTPTPRNLQLRLKNAMHAYSQAFDGSRFDSYYFHGRTGTGKTYMALCVGHELLKRGFSVYFLSYNELMLLLRQHRILTSSFSPDPIRLEQSERFYQKIYACDFLIIDDLGSAAGDGGVHGSELLSLINERLSQKKAMLITTNLDHASIQKIYDERLLSRLLGSFTPVRFVGEDVRTLRKRRS